jgi:hypothetical protein
VTLESPGALLGRLKLGREEFCQRLLTMLILNAPYPKWNSRSTPSAEGLAFLRDLHRLSFGDPWPGDAAMFVDEFELPPRHEDDAGGAPDYAVLWDGHPWMIELKTERASHRKGQVRGYFELAQHHYPVARVDLLYVTPPMDAPYKPDRVEDRYAHTTWGDLTELITPIWADSPDQDRRVLAQGLLDSIASFHLKPAEWRLSALEKAGMPMEPSPASLGEGEDLVDRATEVAGLTAEDGAQRAVEFQPKDLQDVLDLRATVRARLASSDANSPLRRVMPWVWTWQSTGRPLTVGGEDVGVELRLSRYERQLY